MIIQSASMEPTLKSGDRILVLNRAYQFFLKRGQLVVLSLPTLTYDTVANNNATYFVPKTLLVKRLVALEGDNIAHSGFAEPIPIGHVFVLADNPNGNDSRLWGPLPLSSLRGIVIAHI